MKDYKEEGLVLAGMLVVLLGVMFAAAATVALTGDSRRTQRPPLIS